jgi:hypothetical protein
MADQLKELAWNILDWPSDGVLDENNIGYNMREFMRSNGGNLPKAFIVRPDQANTLMKQFRVEPPKDIYGFNTIHTESNGSYQLVIVPRKEQPSEPTKKKR